MAKVYYVQDGSLRESSGPGRDISLAVLEHRLTGHDLRILVSCRRSLTLHIRREMLRMW